MLLQGIRKVNVQKLFAVALTLKIISSGLGFWLQSPWILGLIVPITIMIAYMVLGHYAREDDVSAEKFADSCYYLGFIFTISSIIFSLFDLPNLGAVDGLKNIALRFGAAMVSTVLGMGVRVYLVSFRKDAADAVRDAEDAVLDATRILVSQLNSAVESLKQFEINVVEATKLTVETVNRQVEALGQNYAQSLNGFYVKTTEENRAAFQSLIQEVRTATVSLARSVDIYSGGVKGNLESIERKVTEFSDGVTDRLKGTTFPDDFFAKELRTPLNQVKEEAAKLGASVNQVSVQVVESSKALGDALKVVESKSKKAKDSMDAVLQLTEQQKSIVDNAGIQLNLLGTLSVRLESIEAAIKGALAQVQASNSASNELREKVALISDGSASLKDEIRVAIGSLTSKLEANATLAAEALRSMETKATELNQSANVVISSLQKHADATGNVALQLGVAGIASEAIVSKLQNISEGNVQLIGNAAQVMRVVSTVAQQAGTAVQSAASTTTIAREAVSEVADVARDMKSLDLEFRRRSDEVLESNRKILASQELRPSEISNAVERAFAARGESRIADTTINAESAGRPAALSGANLPVER